MDHSNNFFFMTKFPYLNVHIKTEIGKELITNRNLKFLVRYGAVTERSQALSSGSNGCEFETTLGHQCRSDLSMLISIGYRQVVATSVV